MNKTINKLLLAETIFTLKLHLKHPGSYSACGQFTKHRERIPIFTEAGNLKHLHKNEIFKGCFTHDAAHSDSKDLAQITFFDKKERAKEIVRNLKYDGYFDMDEHQQVWSIKLLRKKEGSRLSVKEQIATRKKINKRKIFAIFKDKIWAAELAEMQSL